MKEVTRIATLQITIIEQCKDDLSDLRNKESAKKQIAKAIKDKFIVDDAVVTEIQDFISDDAQSCKNSIMNHFTKVE